MGRRPLLKRSALRPTFGSRSLTPGTTCGISSPFGLLFPTSGQVTYVLRTHSPLRLRIATKSAFDLHVLSTPPAFILSQDQTLRRELLIYPVHQGPVRVQIKAIHDTGRGSPQVSTPKSRHPLKHSSGVFPITSQLLRSAADGCAVRWRHSVWRQSRVYNNTARLSCQGGHKSRCKPVSRSHR
jgi:hypothetical protein